MRWKASWLRVEMSEDDSRAITCARWVGCGVPF
jgi:hypothetical protein